MVLSRHLPHLTVGVILLGSLLSGPMVGAVDLSSEDARTIAGNGSVHVEVTSVPEDGRLAPARYATTGYVLSLPPATVDVSNLSGNPMVVYKLRIPELGYVAGTTHVLNERFTGRQTLTFDEAVLNRSALRYDTYRGELLILKRVHERDTVLYRGNVTLRVER